MPIVRKNAIEADHQEESVDENGPGRDEHVEEQGEDNEQVVVEEFEAGYNQPGRD